MRPWRWRTPRVHRSKPAFIIWPAAFMARCHGVTPPPSSSTWVWALNPGGVSRDQLRAGHWGRSEQCLHRIDRRPTTAQCVCPVQRRRLPGGPLPRLRRGDTRRHMSCSGAPVSSACTSVPGTLSNPPKTLFNVTTWWRHWPTGIWPTRAGRKFGLPIALLAVWLGGITTATARTAGPVGPDYCLPGAHRPQRIRASHPPPHWTGCRC